MPSDRRRAEGPEGVGEEVQLKGVLLLHLFLSLPKACVVSVHLLVCDGVREQ